MKNFLDDYRNNFCNQIAEIKTKQETLRIFFNDRQLPHLLGLHYLSNLPKGASKILEEIERGNLSLETVEKDPNFYKIKSRIENYTMLKKIFFDKGVDYIIKNVTKNPKRLQGVGVVIPDYNGKENMVILGLSEVNGNYVPATLFKMSCPNGFMYLPRIKIESINLLNKSVKKPYSNE